MMYRHFLVCIVFLGGGLLGAVGCFSSIEKSGEIESEQDDPYYSIYINEIESTASSIISLSREPCLVFNIVSDTHEFPNKEVSMTIVNNTYNNIRRVNNLYHSDGVVHLGDALTPSNETLYPGWEQVNSQLADNIRRMRKSNDTVFFVLGNHDGLQGNYVNEYETFEAVHAISDGYVIRDGNAPWYYIDYPDVHTRVAFLAVPSRDLSKDGEIYYGIYYNQMNWIANTVFNVGDGWNILFFGHINPVHPSFKSASRVVFSELSKAFIDHTSYSNKNWGISVDYTSLANTNILAFISGHAHADAVITDDSFFTTYNFSFPIVVIASSNRQMGGNNNPGYFNPIRKAGTVSEDLWDTMVYRPDLEKMFFIRFGAGEDRVIDCKGDK